jgi:hypothetical protein
MVTALEDTDGAKVGEAMGKRQKSAWVPSNARILTTPPPVLRAETSI